MREPRLLFLDRPRQRARRRLAVALVGSLIVSLASAALLLMQCTGAA